MTLMQRNFLGDYLASFGRIEGYFSPDAALLFMAYNQLIAAQGVAGDVLEIGVHHGLSAIAVAALRGPGRRLVAVDLFDDLQDQNVSRSGYGNKDRFLRNMRQFHDNTDFVVPKACLSSELKPADLGGGFSFCHVDGGHSPAETAGDLRLCAEILKPGGLLALDDYFNPGFPGVCEGAIQFAASRPGLLKPVAIGANKVLFQKAPAPADLNAAFTRAFPGVPHTGAVMWDVPVYLFGPGLVRFFDLERSSPGRLVPAEVPVRAALEPESATLRVQAGEVAELPVKVTNHSGIPFTFGTTPFGLSYHLLSQDGQMLRHDNQRAYFHQPLPPEESRVVRLPVAAPDRPGQYRIELDVVWEGVAWLKQRGSPTAEVKLLVQ